MPQFYRKSESRLTTCAEDIQTVCRTVIQVYDFSVLHGHRTEQEQLDLYVQGRVCEDGVWRVVDKKKIVTYRLWPNSDHNTNPSNAVDIAPYPIDWKNIRRFYELAGRMLQVAYLLDIPLKWGGHWTGSLKDYPHFYLTPMRIIDSHAA